MKATIEVDLPVWEFAELLRLFGASLPIPDHVRRRAADYGNKEGDHA